MMRIRMPVLHYSSYSAIFTTRYGVALPFLHQRNFTYVSSDDDSDLEPHSSHSQPQSFTKPPLSIPDVRGVCITLHPTFPFCYFNSYF